MTCKICGVGSTSMLCGACEANKDEMDNYSGQNHDTLISRIMNMPDDLFFYGLKKHILLKDTNGTPLVDYLCKVDNGTIWERLKGYRGSRGVSYQSDTNSWANPYDRYDTNPIKYW